MHRLPVPHLGLNTPQRRPRGVGKGSFSPDRFGFRVWLGENTELGGGERRKQLPKWVPFLFQANDLSEPKPNNADRIPGFLRR